MNEKEISKQLKEDGIDTSDLKSISKFEQWLKTQNVYGYESHIQFMRDLQELRSSGSGHVKGKSYRKMMGKLGYEDKTLSSIYEDLMNKADSYLKYMMSEFL